MSTTLAILRQRMSEKLGDWFTSTVTTALAAGTTAIDTTLANVEGGNTNGTFESRYIIPTSLANASSQRRVLTYTGSSTTMLVTGGNWTSDGTGKATYELHKIAPAEKTRALNSAARELYPSQFRKIVDRSIVTGNVLPDFNWWTSSSVHKFYSTTNLTSIARTAPTSAIFTHGERYCAKATASAADGYMYLSSFTYPWLLDLQGQSVSAYVWAVPEVLNDAFLTIYTIKNDGTTTQTLSSTTTCAASQPTLLKLENQTLNTDLAEVQLRLRVHTNAKYVYFMSPRLVGKQDVYDYMLPELLQDGSVRQVRLQVTGFSTDKCDDLGLVDWAELFGWKTITMDIGGTNYKGLHIPSYQPQKRRLELTGIAPLEDTLSADTDTMDIDDPKTEAVVAWANMLLYEIRRGVVSSQTTDKYNSELNYWRARAEELKRKHRMIAPPKQIGWTIDG